MKTRNLLTVFAACLLAHTSHAGPSTGGGGDVALLPDDRIVLADPFVRVIDSGDLAKGGELKISPLLRAELLRLVKILRPIAGYDNGASLENRILQTRVRHYAVSKLPDYEECGEQMYPQVACSIGNRTWIQLERFGERALREQVLVLTAQALTVVRPRIHPQVQQDILTGLNVGLELYNRQAQGERSPLSAQEQNQLLVLYQGLAKAKLGYAVPDSIAGNGGGALFGQVTLHPATFVGVGTVIRPGALIGEGVELVDTSICQNGKCRIEADAKIRYADMNGGIVGRNAKIFLSKIFCAGGCLIGPEAWIENVALDVSGPVKVGEGASVRNLPKVGVTFDSPRDSIEWLFDSLAGLLRQETSGLEFPARSQFDFLNREVCAGEAQVYVGQKNLVLEPNNQLSDYCRSYVPR